jgi:hypothetical protein
MSDTPEPIDHPPEAAAPQPATDEHPLSLLLFSWMRGRNFDRLFMAVIAATCAVLAALDFIVKRRHVGDIEHLPAFFGLFGFIVFGLVVLSGWPFGRLLRRPENYYDPPKPLPNPEHRGHDD